MVLWTGDNAPHDVWKSSEHEVTQSTISMTNALSSIGASIFPIQGGFDTYPVNYQDFSQPNSNNAIKSYAQAWSSFLDAGNQQLYKRFGYYSQ